MSFSTSDSQPATAFPALKEKVSLFSRETDLEGIFEWGILGKAEKGWASFLKIGGLSKCLYI